MSEWIEHDGRTMPVAGDAKVQVRFRSGKEDLVNPWSAAEWDLRGNWSHHPPCDADIVAYRVIHAHLLTPSKARQTEEARS